MPQAILDVDMLGLGVCSVAGVVCFVKRVSCSVELPSPLVVILCSICLPLRGDVSLCLQCKIRYNCLELLYLRVIGTVCACASDGPVHLSQ